MMGSSSPTSAKISMRAQLILIMAVCFTLMFAIMYFMFYSSMEKLLSDWEEDNLQQEALLSESVLSASVSYIPSATRDRATWDDMYYAVEEGGASLDEFAADYMSPTDYELFRVNLMAIVDLDSNVIFEQFYDYRNERFMDSYPDIHSVYQRIAPITQYMNKNITEDTSSLDYTQTGTSGFVVHDDQIYYLSAFPILKTNASGPSVGTHITGRIITEKELSSLLFNANLEFSFVSTSSIDLPEDQMKELNQNNRLFVTHSNGAVAYKEVSDIYGIESLAIVLESERNLFAQGNDFIRQMFFLLSIGAVAVVLLIMIILNKLFVQPLATLAREVDGINLQTSDRMIGMKKSNREMAHLTTSMNNMLSRIKFDRDVIRENADKLYYSANYDKLTGLRNRQSMKDLLDDMLHKEEDTGVGITVFQIDLDRFKYINDSLGHTMGDAFIKGIANRMQERLKDVELARVGGDEFMLIVRWLKGRVECQMYVEKIFDVFSEPFPIMEREILITVSIGSSTFPTDGQNAEVLMSNAEMAMYAAKEQGKGLYAFFQEEFHIAIQRKINIENKIRHAVREECRAFEAYFQPKISMNTGEITHCEALMRWNTPEGMVSPGEFIPPAEETGLIIPMTWWMLDECCRLGRKFEDEGIPQVVSVNISAQVLLHDDFLDHVRESIRTSGMDIRKLDIEITESTLLNDMDRVNYVLKELHEMGAEISVDDFGTGYSSLSYLNRLSVDRLKIDREFISGINNDEESREIVRAILAMASSLKMLVTAEGVEDAIQYAFLKREQCDEAQGYYISRPIPAREYIEFVKQWKINKNKLV